MKKWQELAVLGVVLALGVAATAIPVAAPDSTLICDGIATGVSQLATASVAGRPSFSTRAWVASVKDWFILEPAGATTPVPMVHVRAPDGRDWSRQGVQSLEWLTQGTWSVDESNATGLANDENTCADDLHPCLTVDELLRRIGKLSSYTSDIVVRWLSDTTRLSINLSGIVPGNLSIGSMAPTLVFVGVPTVVRSGVLTGATDAPWTVSDATLPASWSASGCLSTSNGSRVIRKTDRTKHAMMAYENSARTAQTSPTTGYSADYSVSGPASASFAIGDAYEVLALPKFPKVSLPEYSGSFNGTDFIYLDMSLIIGGFSQVRLSGFSGPASIGNVVRTGGIICQGVIFTAGGSIQGVQIQNSFDRSLIMGGSFQGVTWSGDLHGYVNVIAKTGQLWVSHSSYPRLGTLYVYDDTTTAILVDNNSFASIDAIHGSGNTGLIVNVAYSGCSVNSVATTPLTAFDATTSAAHPISVVGAQYDYSGIPITVPAHNASFTTN